MPAYKATFPDRIRPPGLALNYMSPLVVHQLPTSMKIWAENKRDAWQSLHNQFPFERIVIEEVKDA